MNYELEDNYFDSFIKQSLSIIISIVKLSIVFILFFSLKFVMIKILPNKITIILIWFLIDLCFPSSTIISSVKSSLFSCSFKHYKKFSIFEYQSNTGKQLICKAILAPLQALCSLSLSLSIRKENQWDNGEGGGGGGKD